MNFESYFYYSETPLWPQSPSLFPVLFLYIIWKCIIKTIIKLLSYQKCSPEPWGNSQSLCSASSSGRVAIVHAGPLHPPSSLTFGLLPPLLSDLLLCSKLQKAWILKWLRAMRSKTRGQEMVKFFCIEVRDCRWENILYQTRGFHHLLFLSNWPMAPTARWNCQPK